MTSIARPNLSGVSFAELALPHTGRIVRVRWLISTLALRAAQHAGGRFDLSALAPHAPKARTLPDELALDVSVLEPNHVHDGLVDVRLAVPTSAPSSAGGSASFQRLAVDAPRVTWQALGGMIAVRVDDSAGLTLDATFDPARLTDPRRPVRFARTDWLARLGVPGGRAEVDTLDLILPPPRGE
ncbi:MAG: hypothetical protein SFY95_02235 [Planctomycetota bacterium]|nr:hypothetical protein [Planctomycetota bacterium]